MKAVERAFLSRIGDLPSKCVFRGQTDSSWKLHSTATRRLIKFFGGDESVTGEVYFSPMHHVYHRSVLLKRARNLGFGFADGHEVPDLQLLLKLQRFGAATGFLDFSRDPLVALWYACEDVDRDGRVFVLNLDYTTALRGVPFAEAVHSTEEIFMRSGKPEKNVYIEMPMQEQEAEGGLLNGTVSVQAWPMIPEGAVSSFVIRASDKPLIRRELESFFDFKRPSHFFNFLQFSALNSERLPLPHIEDPEFSLLLGNQCCLQGDFAGAIEHYNKGIELAPDADIAYFSYVRGNAKTEAGDLRGACDDYDAALSHLELLSGDQPDSSKEEFNKHLARQLYFNRGNVKSGTDDFEGALADFEEAVSLRVQVGERDPWCFLNKGNVNFLLHRFGEAIVDYEEATKLDGQIAHLNKGNVLVTLGRFDEALQSYDAAIREGETSSLVICNRNSVSAILNRIGGDGYVVEPPRYKDDTRRMIIEVSLRADAKNRYTEFYNFHGNYGNSGNIGSVELPGGRGFKGKVGFVVIVKGEEW